MKRYHTLINAGHNKGVHIALFSRSMLRHLQDNLIHQMQFLYIVCGRLIACKEIVEGLVIPQQVCNPVFIVV